MADGSDVLTGGTIEPRFLEEEMRSSYLDYAMSVIVGRALPDVRDGLKPVHRRVLYAMHDGGFQPNRGYTKCAPHHRRRDGRLPSARRLVDLRHARAHGAVVLDALPARRRPGQLRLDGQRPAGGHALHRGAAREDRDRDAARHRRRHRRLRAQLRRAQPRAARPPVALPEPARERLGGHRGRHGHEHPAAQPARVDRRGHRVHGRPEDRHRRPDEAHQGPGLPDRRHHRRPLRHQGRVRDGSRPRASSARGRTSSRCARARRRSSSPRCPTRCRRATAAATAAG